MLCTIILTHIIPTVFSQSSAVQQLHGECLDYEHHDMSEKHEPAGAPMDQAIPRLAGDIASSRADHARSCSQKIHNVVFCEQEKSVPRCRRRIGPFVQADAWFGTDRVTPVKVTSYAVLRTRVLFASGRAEENIII
jgi:hypothetical protein